jgi:hypothetical protein
MKRTIFLVMVAMLLPLTVGSVGLGLSLGAALPQGSTDQISSTDWGSSFNWGFYVNIPLINTFHLTPSAELYRLGEMNATDMSIAFKFIVPLSTLHLYGGFIPGLTAVSGLTVFHAGILFGGSFRLISNLDLFIQGKYKYLFEGNQNMRILHINAGVLLNL